MHLSCLPLKEEMAIWHPSPSLPPEEWRLKRWCLKKKVSIHPVLLLPKRRNRRLTVQSLCPGQANAPQDREKHKFFFFKIENRILSLPGNSQWNGWEAGSALPFSNQNRRNKEIWQVLQSVLALPGQANRSSIWPFFTQLLLKIHCEDKLSTKPKAP